MNVHTQNFNSTRQCNTMQYSATCCNMLQHSLQRLEKMSEKLIECARTDSQQCNTVQYSALQCNILQHSLQRLEKMGERVGEVHTQIDNNAALGDTVQPTPCTTQYTPLNAWQHSSQRLEKMSRQHTPYTTHHTHHTPHTTHHTTHSNKALSG